MKKFLALLTGALAVCGLSANPLGNAADPVIFEDGISAAGKTDTAFRLGFSGDYVTDRHLHTRHVPNSKTISAEKEFQALEGTVTLFDRFDVFGKLGYSMYDTYWRFPSPGNDGQARRLRTRNDFAWGLGGKAILYQWDNTTLSVSGGYTQGSAKVETLQMIHDTLGGEYRVFNSGVKQREHKWNVGATVGYVIDNLAPYIGLQYVKDKVKFNKPTLVYDDGGVSTSTALPKFENSKKISAVLGVGLVTGKKASLNIEGRFIGESAVTLTCQARF